MKMKFYNTSGTGSIKQQLDEKQSGITMIIVSKPN